MIICQCGWILVSVFAVCNCENVSPTKKPVPSWFKYAFGLPTYDQENANHALIAILYVQVPLFSE